MPYASPHPPVSALFGAPPPPASGRGRIVHAAIQLFYRHGFQAVGIDQVLAAAGVTKTTFYKHFESRDELMIEAIRTRDRWERQAWGDAMRELGGDDPADQLLALFDLLDIWFNDPDFRGCQFINAAAEFANPSDPVHEVAAEHKRATHAEFRGLAEAAGFDDPAGFADRYNALVEGTLVLRQVHGRDDAAKAIKPAVAALIEASRPAG